MNHRDMTDRRIMGGLCAGMIALAASVGSEAVAQSAAQGVPNAMQGVLRGDRLMVDMTTGVSRVESDRGPVYGLFVPSGKGCSPAVPAPGARPG
jgi:hypothetical protein